MAELPALMAARLVKALMEMWRVSRTFPAAAETEGCEIKTQQLAAEVMVQEKLHVVAELAQPCVIEVPVVSLSPLRREMVIVSRLGALADDCSLKTRQLLASLLPRSQRIWQKGLVELVKSLLNLQSTTEGPVTVVRVGALTVAAVHPVQTMKLSAKPELKWQDLPGSQQALRVRVATSVEPEVTAMMQKPGCTTASYSPSLEVAVSTDEPVACMQLEMESVEASVVLYIYTTVEEVALLTDTLKVAGVEQYTSLTTSFLRASVFWMVVMALVPATRLAALEQVTILTWQVWRMAVEAVLKSTATPMVRQWVLAEEAVIWWVKTHQVAELPNPSHRVLRSMPEAVFRALQMLSIRSAMPGSEVDIALLIMICTDTQLPALRLPSSKVATLKGRSRLLKVFVQEQVRAVSCDEIAAKEEAAGAEVVEVVVVQVKREEGP